MTVVILRINTTGTTPPMIAAVLSDSEHVLSMTPWKLSEPVHIKCHLLMYGNVDILRDQ